MTYFDRVSEAAAFLRPRLDRVPETAIILGSGLGAFGDRLKQAVTLRYEDIPHWPASRVVGHAGRLVSGKANGRPVLVLSGRAHFYEGHDLGTVTFATRVLGRLGVKTLIVTNAAGGINLRFEQGALMLIDDHINLLGPNPLIGPNDDRFGRRFPDMSEVYSKRLRAIAAEAAAAAGQPLEHGVYIAVTGPSYETPAEIRAFRVLGADAVGMSTVPEVIVARHCGLRVAAVSAITNLAEGMGGEELSHEQTLRVAKEGAERLGPLIERFVAELP